MVLAAGISELFPPRLGAEPNGVDRVGCAGAKTVGSLGKHILVKQEARFCQIKAAQFGWTIACHDVKGVVASTDGSMQAFQTGNLLSLDTVITTGAN